MPTPIDPTLTRLTYNCREARTILGVSRATFYRLIQRGLIHTTGAGLRTHLVEVAELQRYLNDDGEDADRAERSE